MSCFCCCLYSFQRITMRMILLTLWFLVANVVCSQQQQHNTGLELDREMEDELLKAYTASSSSDSSSSSSSSSSRSMDLQDISEDDMKIVLMDEASPPQSIMKSSNVLYQVGNSDEDLPECEQPNDVCNKIDVYGEPWLEKQCRCSSGRICSDSLHTDDGHTIVDRHFRYKLCEPVKRLPICRYFKDTAWTIETNVGPMNATVHRVQCRCRPNSSSYLLKRQIKRNANGEKKFIYHFSCSPQSRNKCNLAVKEPCRLTTVHKKRQFSFLDETTSAQLCQCPRGYRCPKKHTDVGNIPSRTFYLDDLPVKVYSGHCTPTRHLKEPIYTLVH